MPEDHFEVSATIDLETYYLYYSLIRLRRFKNAHFSSEWIKMIDLICELRLASDHLENVEYRGYLWHQGALLLAFHDVNLNLEH